MDNLKHEGLPVAGYQPQRQHAVDAVNSNKVLEEHVLRQIERLQNNPDLDLDLRWLAIGRTEIEKAFMAINRAVFKPARVKLPEDPS